MDKRKRENINLTIKALFEEYGKIELIEVKDKSIFYLFLCDSSKLFDKDDILSHMGDIKFALLVKSSYECFMYSFRIGSSKGIAKYILSLINKANSSLEYGKFILSGNDIDWEFKIDLRYTTQKDINKILKVFMMSLLNLAVNINEEKNRKNK